MRYMLRITAHRDYNQPKREIYIVGSKPGKSELIKPFDARHAVRGFGICFDGFWSHYSPVFLMMFPFWNIHFGMVMYIQCHLTLEE